MSFSPFHNASRMIFKAGCRSQQSALAVSLSSSGIVPGCHCRFIQATALWRKIMSPFNHSARLEGLSLLMSFSRFFCLFMKLKSTAKIDHILNGGALPHSTQVLSTLIELVDCRCNGPCNIIRCRVFCWKLAVDWTTEIRTIPPVQRSDVEHQYSVWRMSRVDDYGVRIFRIAVLRLLRNCQRPFPFPANLCSCCSWLHA